MALGLGIGHGNDAGGGGRRHERLEQVPQAAAVDDLDAVSGRGRQCIAPGPAFGEQDAVAGAGQVHRRCQLLHARGPQLVGHAMLARQQPEAVAVAHHHLFGTVLVALHRVAQAALLHGLADDRGELAPAQVGNRAQARRVLGFRASNQPQVGHGHHGGQHAQCQSQNPRSHPRSPACSPFRRADGRCYTAVRRMRAGREKVARQSVGRKGRGANGRWTGGPCSILPQPVVPCNIFRCAYAIRA